MYFLTNLRSTRYNSMNTLNEQGVSSRKLDSCQQPKKIEIHSAVLASHFIIFKRCYRIKEAFVCPFDYACDDILLSMCKWDTFHFDCPYQFKHIWYKSKRCAQWGGKRQKHWSHFLKPPFPSFRLLQIVVCTMSTSLENTTILRSHKNKEIKSFKKKYTTSILC